MVDEEQATTTRLVRRSRAGDAAAFADLVELYQGAVFGTILRLVGDREVAVDVANRAFFKAYQHLDSFDDARPARPWLLRIAANEALNEIRGRARGAAHTVQGEEAERALERASGGRDPAEIVGARESRASVRAAVACLPETMRLVTVLRYFDDLSYAEIAEQTGLSTNAVGVTLLRARDRIRRELLARETSDALS
jgi:RNA polymerase sigma-70 factor (ECF subfamily)